MLDDITDHVLDEHDALVNADGLMLMKRQKIRCSE